jgi:hypothetical protein
LGWEKDAWFGTGGMGEGSAKGSLL